MSETSCSLCHTHLLPREAVESCPECAAVYHAECHADNGGCGTYGCSRVPGNPEQAVAVVTPTFWGQQTKTCPACDQPIRAAALRCRHCGARFASAAPVGKEEYARGIAEKNASVTVQRLAPWILLGGIIPCTAPLVLCIGLPYLQLFSREQLRGLAPFQRLLTRLGFVVAGVWVVVGLLVLLAT